MRKALVAVVLATALSACGGGGGGGSSAVTPATPANPGGTSGTVGGGGGTTSSLPTATIRLKLTAASATASQGRSPSYVSSATKGVLVQVYSHADTAHATVLGSSTTDVSPGSAACGGATGTRVCTIVIPAPAGTDDFVFTTYDAAPVAGSFSAAHQLGGGSVSNQTIAANSPNTVNVAIGGTVASITIFPPGITFLNSTSTQTALLTITALDSSGNAIIGGALDPYVNPITVTSTESGGYGHLYLFPYNPGTSFQCCSSSATLSHSTDTAYVQYDGKGSAGYHATLSASSPATATTAAVPAVTGQVTPIFVTTASTYLNPGYPPTLNFTAAGQSATLQAYEFGSHSFTTAGTNCAGIASFTQPGSPVTDPTLGFNETFTITAGASTGSCTVNLVDFLVQSPITVNVTSGTPTTTTTIGIPAASPSPLATTVPVPQPSPYNAPFSVTLPTYNGYSPTMNLNQNGVDNVNVGPSANLLVQLSSAPVGGMPVLQGAPVNQVLLYAALQPTNFGFTDYNGATENIVFTTTSPSGTYHLAAFTSQYPTQGWLVDPFGPGVVNGNTITFTKPANPYVGSLANGFGVYSNSSVGFALYK